MKSGQALDNTQLGILIGVSIDARFPHILMVGMYHRDTGQETSIETASSTESLTCERLDLPQRQYLVKKSH